MQWRKLEPRSREQREAIKRRDRGQPLREIAWSYNAQISKVSRLGLFSENGGV